MKQSYKQIAAIQRRGQRIQPSFSTLYTLGVAVASKMHPHKTYVEIGREFGISRQNAYNETMIALGKLTYRLREVVREQGNNMFT